MPQRRTAVSRLIVLLVAGSALLVLIQSFHRPSRPTPPVSLINADWPLMLATAGEDELQTLIRADGLPQSEQRQLLDAMLRSDRPEVRAAGCLRVARQRDAGGAWLLIQRMSDQDWRVRSAAFEAMESLGTAGDDSSAPLRDTPVEQREQQILRWIGGLKTLHSGATPSLCDLYAFPRHWLTGSRLARACMDCHAPVSEYGKIDLAQCADCHNNAHATWATSAHAQSTTHLNLLQVNQGTRQIEPYPYGYAGIDCVACHRPEPDAPVTEGTKHLPLPHRFRRSSAAESCVSCHSHTEREWRTWSTNTRPQAARWPSGEIEWTNTSSAPSCVDCHMREEQSQSHGFATRRNDAVMRSGIHARIEPATDGREATLVVTNLAGHANPTGTHRRGIRVDCWFDDSESSRRTLARWSAYPLNSGPAAGQPLAPAEERRITLPRNDQAAFVTCQVIFERNHLDPGAMEVLLAQASGRLTRPLSPK